MENHILEIVVAIIGYFINRSIVGMDNSIKDLTTKFNDLALFASRAEAILEQHEKDIESLKQKP